MAGWIYQDQLKIKERVLSCDPSGGSMASYTRYLTKSYQAADGLTELQSETLKHIRYNPVTNQIESDREVQTTLNSFYLGDQHKMSSGAENIFFTNLNSKINFFPAWSGLRDHRILANRGTGGVVTPSIRKYADMQTLTPYGAMATSGSVPYNKAATLLGNHSVLGQTFVVMEPVYPKDWLVYQVWYGTDETGIQAYEQKFTGNTYSANQVVDWWFTHPIEGFVDTPIVTCIKIRKGSEDGQSSYLRVRPSASNPLNHYSAVRLRVFEDKEIVLGMLPLKSNTTITNSAMYMVDTNVQTITVTVDLNSGVKSFTVVDCNQMFGIRNCTVNFGAQGSMLLRVRGDNVHFYHDGSLWRYYNVRTGETGLIAVGARTGVVPISITKLLTRTGQQIGDVVQVAYDPVVDGNGTVTSYTESGAYMWTSAGWSRVEASQVLHKTTSFLARDGDTYIVEQPVKSDTGSNVDRLYQFRGDIVASSSHQVDRAIKLFNNSRNTAATDDASSCGSPWTNSAENTETPFRVILDFGETVQLVGMEFQGQGNTGYTTPNGPLPISGPKNTTVRFSNVAFSAGANSGTGNVANFSKQWSNLNWGANRSSPNGLAESFDLKAANGGNPISCRYFAMDCATSWDTRSIVLRHIAFIVSVPNPAAAITVTVNPTVKSFHLIDGNGNTGVYSPIDVNLGTDTIKFSRSFIGKRYSFLRSVNKFIVIGSDGSRTEGNV